MATLLVRSFTDPAVGLATIAAFFLGGPYVEVLWTDDRDGHGRGCPLPVLAYPLAFAMTKARGSLLRVMGAMVLIPLWTSVVIRSYGWMVIFQRRGVLNRRSSRWG